MNSPIIQIANLSEIYDENPHTDERLKKIHEIPNIFKRTCKLCNSKPKKIWKVVRWGYINNDTVNTYYCKKCLPTKKDVLYEIDTDESAMGIAFCDSPIYIKKLDYSRLRTLPPNDEH